MGSLFTTADGHKAQDIIIGRQPAMISRGFSTRAVRLVFDLLESAKNVKHNRNQTSMCTIYPIPMNQACRKKECTKWGI